MMGYTVKWEPTRRHDGLIGEWVARAKSGWHSIAYPAYVVRGAGAVGREEAKISVLHKLVCLLEGSV